MSCPPGFRELMFQRAHYRCERCGSTSNGLTLSHRIARSRGGPFVAWNINVLCGSGTTGCHGFVEHNPVAAEREGWRIRGFIVRGVYTGPSVFVHRVVNGES